jgi:hypothetical protein
MFRLRIADLHSRAHARLGAETRTGRAGWLAALACVPVCIDRQHEPAHVLAAEQVVPVHPENPILAESRPLIEAHPQPWDGPAGRWHGHGVSVGAVEE